jgi:hypothetical protein
LPFLTVLAPSERYYAKSPRVAKKLTDWGRQMLLQARRWLPDRLLVVVADSSFAVIELLWRMTQLANPICMITRFRLDAALYEPPPPRPAGRKGRPRLKGARLPTLKKVAADDKTDWTRSPSETGMEKHNARSRLRPTQPFGITLASRPCPSAGC